MIRIIIALLLLRLDYIIGFNNPPSSHYSHHKLSSPTLLVRVSAYSASDDGYSQNYLPIAQRRLRPPISNIDKDGAPSRRRRRQQQQRTVVDSELLRFLAAQKQNAFDASPYALALRKNTTTTTTTTTLLSPLSAMDLSTVDNTATLINGPEVTSDERGDVMEVDNTIINSPEEDGITTTTTENQSLFSQYNSQIVAMKLQALDVDPHLALRAGTMVQEYVIERVTRRRIRRFIKERNVPWEKELESSRENAEVRQQQMITMGKNYDIDAILEVMTEHGLTGNDIATIFTHTPSIAMMRARSMTEIEIIQRTDGKTDGEIRSYSLEEIMNRVFVGLLGDTLKLRRYDARKVLRATTGVLTPKGSTSAVQVVTLMMSLGSSPNAIARDKSSLSTLLCRSPALLFRLVAFLSSAQLKVPLNAIGTILRQKQSANLLNSVAPLKQRPVVTMDIQDSNIIEESEVLEYLESSDINTTRQCHIEESYCTMENVADALRRSAGIRDFSKLLSSHPDVFFVNVDNIHAITSFLRNDVGMTKEDVARVIQTFPTILLEQDVSMMKDVVNYLRSVVEIDENDLPSILRSFPATLLLDVDTNIIPVVSFLRDIGVRNIGRFVTRIPPVLGYSVETDLRPKWNFLREVCQFDYFEVVRFPAYFSYPLDRVIKMRYEYLRDCKGIPIQLARVDDVLRFGDRDFAIEIALDNDDGIAFAKFVDERSRRKQNKLT